MSIKNAVVNQIIEKWNLDARNPECEDGSESAKIGNARASGKREGIAFCADQLRALVELLATPDSINEPTCDKPARY